MILNKHYSKKVSGYRAYSWVIVVILSLFFAASAVVLGLIAIFYLLIKRKKHKSLHLFILPMLSVAFLSLGINAFMQVYNNSYRLFQLGTPSPTAILIFIGFTLFGVCAPINALVLIKNLNTITSRFKQGFLILTALSLLLLAGVLLMNGWIGLIFWNL